jgi:uracil-DNA glycosylase
VKRERPTISSTGAEVSVPGSAADYLPARRTLASLARAAAGCRGCPLYRDATRVVFGEGPPDARLMLVGEQPGDREDLEGHPFVGPAGRLLDRALAAASIDRGAVYLTNAVKHFKWTSRGKRRIHEKPNRAETRACRPWLEAEIEVVAPRVIVCLGATAAQSLLGPSFRITRDRGRAIATDWAPSVVATAHPSSVIRLGGGRERDEALDGLVRDLEVARRRAG